MLICIATGFTSGLPLYLLLNLVPAWLKTEGLSLKLIGAMALIQFPYTWKFLWSPLLDRFALPWLGRRRSWMLLTQIVLLLAIAGLGQISVAALVQGSASMPLEARDWWNDLVLFAPLFALTGVIAFFSATQDIVLDAFRRELLPDVELGLGNAFHVNAYRIAGLIPGSVSLILADHLAWNSVFLITALFMLPGILATAALARGRGGALPRILLAPWGTQCPADSRLHPALQAW
jgi:PAT family beta-lactamase induction signal transducer AmpG